MAQEPLIGDMAERAGGRETVFKHLSNERVYSQVSSKSLLASSTPALANICGIFCLPTFSDVRDWFNMSTDIAFIQSEVNGRQSRRVVLFAFYITEVFGGLQWASWCIRDEAVRQSDYGICGPLIQDTCNSFGVNHYLLLSAALPVEGVILWLAGWKPWSFWSDSLILPVWLIRLVVFDMVMWRAPPGSIMADVLWFFVLAVMCRVHSLALIILAGMMVFSVYATNYAVGMTDATMEFTRYGHYGVTMTLITAGAYFLDELRRVRAFQRLMWLEGNNSELAENLLSWKMLTGDPESCAESGRNTEDNSLDRRWRHTVLDEDSPPESCYSGAQRHDAVLLPEPLPLPLSARPPGRGMSPSKVTDRYWPLVGASRHERFRSGLVPTTRPRVNAGQSARSQSSMDPPVRKRQGNRPVDNIFDLLE